MATLGSQTERERLTTISSSVTAAKAVDVVCRMDKALRTMVDSVPGEPPCGSQSPQMRVSLGIQLRCPIYQASSTAPRPYLRHGETPMEDSATCLTIRQMTMRPSHARSVGTRRQLSPPHCYITGSMWSAINARPQTTAVATRKQAIELWNKGILEE